LKIVKKILGGVFFLFLLMTAEVWIQEKHPFAEEELGAIVFLEKGQERLAAIEPVLEMAPETELELVQEAEAKPLPEELPAVYDYRQEGRAPMVKDQEQVNNCWAYAGTSALESALLPGENLVLSADHMTYQNSYAFAPEEGGAYVMAVAYLTSWQGPVREEDDPSGDGVSPEGLNAVKQVLDVRFLGDKDYDAIKWTILQYGGVESSIYMDFTQEDGSSASYSPEACSYCYLGETQSNHDVLMIGWDDTYPAENFLQQPEGDGAFICQNSWGEEFGESGIFYVSYYDSNIGKNTAAYTRIENAGYFDGVYQSDLCGWTGQVGYNTEEAWFSSIYTAEQAEELEAAGFYATGPESTYEVYVVSEFTDPASLNKRSLVGEGHLQYGGYYTVEFSRNIPLKQGQRFALVVHMTTKDAVYPIAVEYEQKEDPRYTVTLEDGESYISDKGKLWSRAEEECQSNVCLKAYVSRS
jgi:C1A family cysteine protease